MLRNSAHCICKRILNNQCYVGSKPMFVSSNSLLTFQSEIIKRKHNSNFYCHTLAGTNLESTQIRKFQTSTACLAGHSQWANRKAGKQIQDRKKSDIRMALLKNIMAVIKQTGETDPKFNTKLQKLFDQAKQKDVPKATLDNLMKKISSQSFELTTVEISLPGNLYMIYEISSSNMSNTINELKCICRQARGHLEKHYNSHIFEEKGFVDVEIGENEKADAEQYVDIAIEAGAEDVFVEENEGEKYIRFVCEPADLYQVKGKLEKLDLNVINFINEYFPHELIELDETHKKYLKMWQNKLDSNLLASCVERKFNNFIEKTEEE